MSFLVKRSVCIAGHRSSVALEAEFWSALEALAAARAQTLPAVIVQIDAARDAAQPLASALRLAGLRWSCQQGMPKAASPLLATADPVGVKGHQPS